MTRSRAVSCCVEGGSGWRTEKSVWRSLVLLGVSRLVEIRPWLAQNTSARLRSRCVKTGEPCKGRVNGMDLSSHAPGRSKTKVRKALCRRPVSLGRAPGRRDVACAVSRRLGEGWATFYAPQGAAAEATWSAIMVDKGPGNGAPPSPRWYPSSPHAGWPNRGGTAARRSRPMAIHF